MPESLRVRLPRAPSPGVELAAVLVLAMLLTLWMVLATGGVRLSWDALNHHIYLGWIAEKHRLDHDVLAAGHQGFQFPYLYWPVYKLATSGASAQATAIVLAALHLPAVPAVWMIARSCMPGDTLAATAMRMLAVFLAFLTGAVLALLDATSNDLLAAIPLVWAIAFGLRAVEPGRTPSEVMRAMAWSGLLAGVSVGCKFSNGPIAILLPLLWVFAPAAGRGRRTLHLVVGGGMTIAGLVVTYGYWGWLLWARFGNPLYPFFDNHFAPVRQLLGWQG